jgi:hypothetical protein
MNVSHTPRLLDGAGVKNQSERRTRSLEEHRTKYLLGNKCNWVNWNSELSPNRRIEDETALRVIHGLDRIDVGVECMCSGSCSYSRTCCSGSH